MSEDRLLSKKDLAMRWGITQRTLENWRSAGTGPKWIILGTNRVRYRIEDVKEFESARVGQTATKLEESKND